MQTDARKRYWYSLDHVITGLWVALLLSIIAYEQPVTRADVSHIRATDSSGVIETLLARGLITDDPRFDGRGRPSFLVTTAAFLRLLGLGSLTELPSRPIPK